MYILIIVFAIRDLAKGNAHVPTRRLGAQHEANLSTRVCGNSGVSVFGGREDVAGELPQVLNELKVQPEALALGANVASGCKGVMKEFEIWLLEESFGWADRIRGVGDDDVVCSFVVGKELKAVADVDSYARIGKQGGHVREVGLGNADDGLLKNMSIF
jgi:hypothetical protein